MYENFYEAVKKKEKGSNKQRRNRRTTRRTNGAEENPTGAARVREGSACELLGGTSWG
jgi:hypothetical protein